MPRPTDEEIIASKEAQINALGEEERRVYCANEYDEDKRICRRLSVELKADIKPIENDMHHILVNGQIMGYNAFADWKDRRFRELAENKNSTKQLGFFSR